MLPIISCQESFLFAFQKSRGLSTSEWAEYDGKISHLKAFTCCHWEKLDFFNAKSNYMWNYCTINTPSDEMVCMQIYYQRDINSHGRDIRVGLSFGRGNFGYLVVKPFNHRSWNHFCWTYDSSSGENRLFVNGKFHGNIFFDRKLEALGSDEVYDSSFSLGQEPDAFRGQYDKNQAYRGNISEINLWDYVLTNELIADIGLCKRRARGNVIRWDKGKFKLYNITEHKIEDVSRLCIQDEKIFIFPEKHSLPMAATLCESHGGYLFTPRNEEENAKLIAEILTYDKNCNHEGNIFWLGASTKDYQIFSRDSDQNLVPGNFTNWNSPLFNWQNKCVYMKSNGKWVAHTTYCDFLQLCPVCGFIGTPILSLKGQYIQCAPIEASNTKEAQFDNVA